MNSSYGVPRTHLAWILAVCGAVLLTVLLRWNSLTAPFERDEGEYAYSARLLLTGHVPYKESFLQKPPLIVYTFALGQLFFPNAVWPPRVLALLSAIGTSLLIGYISYKEFGYAAGLIAMYLAPPMLAFSHLAALAANTEIFMLFALTAAIAACERLRRVKTFRGSLLIGLLGSLAVLYKPIAIVPIAFLLFVWLRDARSWSNLLGFLAGALSGLAGIVGYFILNGSFHSLWDEAVVFNIYYSTQYGYGLANLWHFLHIFWTHWWFLILLFGWFIYRRPKRWWVWVGFTAASIVAVYQSSLGHYYLLIIPFWAVAISWAMDDVRKRVEGKVGRLGGIGVLGLTGIFLISPARAQITKSPEEIARMVYGYKNPLIESRIVARKLAAATAPGDRVFIAGSEPQLLFYSGRESASRFVITYPLIIDTPKRLDYQKEAVAELSATPPSAIVVSQRMESGLWIKGSPRMFIDYLQDILNHDYRLVGGYVWEADGRFWKDSLSPEDTGKASLLLYKRQRK